MERIARLIQQAYLSPVGNQSSAQGGSQRNVILDDERAQLLKLLFNGSHLLAMPYCQILSTGSYVPERVVTNAEVDALLSDSHQRLAYRQRRHP